MRKVVSYSIFGKNLAYWKYVPTLLIGHYIFFPDWEIHIAHDKYIHQFPQGKMLIDLEKEGLVYLHFYEHKEPLCLSMIRRMHAIWKVKDISIFLSRDGDALPNARDRFAVEDFLKIDNAIFHTINDHKEHIVPILGGMFGCKTKKFKEFTDMTKLSIFKNACKYYTNNEWNNKGCDQDFLGKIIWPRIKKYTFAHWLYPCKPGKMRWYMKEAKEMSIKIKTKQVDGISPEAADISNKIAPFIGVNGYSIKSAKKELSPFLKENIKEKLDKAEKDNK